MDRQGPGSLYTMLLGAIPGGRDKRMRQLATLTKGDGNALLIVAGFFAILF